MAYQPASNAVVQFIEAAKKLTLSQIFKTTLVATLCVLMWLLWENRQPIYEGIRTNATVENMLSPILKERTRTAVQNLVNKPSLIVGIQLISVDFRTNTRNPVLFVSNIPEMQRLMDNDVADSLAPTSFFSENDVENNTRSIRIINGEFVCSPITQTHPIHAYTKLTNYATHKCSVSIPPYPGFFSGYITLFLRHQPSDSEALELKSAVRKLSIEIYDIEFGKY